MVSLKVPAKNITSCTRHFSYSAVTQNKIAVNTSNKG